MKRCTDKHLNYTR